MRQLTSLALVLVLAVTCVAGEISITTDPQTGEQVYRLSQGETIVMFAPWAGANAYSIQVSGVEYLRQPDSLGQLPGVGYGTPVLYPTPNRVKDAQFTFDGGTVRFEPNAGRNFIHGLLNRHRWQSVAVQSAQDFASVRCQASFESGSALGESFPFPHTLFLTVEVREAAVRWIYEVDNSAGTRAIPFGFALHPYFIYQGERAQTFLTIPASHWMESEQQLPSGKLVPAAELDYPLGKPFSLQDVQLDDVFWGLRPEAPTLIDFRDAGRKIRIEASAEFTHLVVWTPDRPYFGIESQTCSTDAHNLHAAGYSKAAHLQICQPGASLNGWVEYNFD